MICLLLPPCRQPFFLCFRLCRVLPGNVAVQIFQKMRPRRFEFIADETETEKPCAESILLVAALGSGVGRTFLNQCLMTDGEAELDVALDLACMECGIE